MIVPQDIGVHHHHKTNNIDRHHNDGGFHNLSHVSHLEHLSCNDEIVLGNNGINCGVVDLRNGGECVTAFHHMSPVCDAGILVPCTPVSIEQVTIKIAIVTIQSAG